jgi:hypothetical protein
MNSSLFYAYFIALGDCYHLSDELVRGFPACSSVFADARIAELGAALDADLRANATRRRIKTKKGPEVEYAQFDVGRSKAILDDIDVALAKHYGFTDEELDFIINYDIKYRMGVDELDDTPDEDS